MSEGGLFFRIFCTKPEGISFFIISWYFFIYSGFMLSMLFMFCASTSRISSSFIALRSSSLTKSRGSSSTVSNGRLSTGSCWESTRRLYLSNEILIAVGKVEGCVCSEESCYFLASLIFCLKREVLLWRIIIMIRSRIKPE